MNDFLITMLNGYSALTTWLVTFLILLGVAGLIAYRLKLIKLKITARRVNRDDFDDVE